MPQSLDLIILHLVFSTQQRRSCLHIGVRPALHAYMATVIRNTGCQCFRVGGTADHVHLALGLTRTINAAELVNKVKTASSAWLKQQNDDFHGFSWQDGYGVFSVSPVLLEKLVCYIDNQEIHHKKKSFQDEYIGFLKKYRISHDERYMWD